MNDQRVRRTPPNKIRSLRKQKSPKWRQRDLALRVGVARSDIGKYERGDRVPTLRMAMRIAVVLSRPVEEVFFGWRDEALTGRAVGDNG